MQSIDFVFLYHIFGVRGNIQRHQLIPVSVTRVGSYMLEFMQARIEADRKVVAGMTHIDDDKAVLMQIIQFPSEPE